MLACDRKAFGRRIAADNVGAGKNLAQVGHAAADAAAEIQDRVDATDDLLCQLDFVAGEIVAVAVEEIRLCGEDRLILTGILIEIDACHRRASCRDRGNGFCPRIRHDGYANKNNKQLRRWI